MNKFLVGGAAALGVVVVGAVVIAPNYFGAKIEDVTRAQLAANQTTPLKTEIVKYERSAGSSDVEIKFGLADECLGEHAATAKDVYILYRAKMSHGPFAGGLNAASYTGELLLSPALEPHYEKATGQKLLASFTGTYGFSGASNAVLTVPKMDVKNSDSKATLAFAGLTVEASTDASAKKFSYTAKSAGAVIKGGGGDNNEEVIIGALDATGKGQLMGMMMIAGDSNIKLKDVVIKKEGKDIGKFEDFVLTSTTTMSDKKIIDGSGKFTIGKITAPEGKVYTNTVIDMAMSNIAADPYARINAKMNCANMQGALAILASAKGGDGNATLGNNFQKVMPAIMEDLKLLVAANPSFEFKKIGAETPEGPIDVAASVKLSGVTDADWANPASLVQRIEAAGKASLPAPLLPKEAQGMLSMLVSKGYAVQKDKLISTNFKWSKGEGSINDKPMAGLAGALAAGQ